LSGKIDEDFWLRRTNGWKEEIAAVAAEVKTLQNREPQARRRSWPPNQLGRVSGSDRHSTDFVTRHIYSFTN